MDVFNYLHDVANDWLLWMRCHYYSICLTLITLTNVNYNLSLIALCWIMKSFWYDFRCMPLCNYLHYTRHCVIPCICLWTRKVHCHSVIYYTLLHWICQCVSDIIFVSLLSLCCIMLSFCNYLMFRALIAQSHNILFALLYYCSIL